MSSGGARARSGPLPDPNALRREHDKTQWTHLPAIGRVTDAPGWPLSPKASKREAEHWAREWARPQALMWEAIGLEVEVGLYVRRLAEAEKPGAPTGLGTLVKQQQETLGLSLPGLARNHWVIDDEPQQQAKATTTDDPDRASAKARFRSIEGGAAS